MLKVLIRTLDKMLLFNVILSLLFLHVLQIEGKLSTDNCHYENKNLLEYDLPEMILNVQSWEKCKELCEKALDCNYWIYHHKNAGMYSYICKLISDYEGEAYDTICISGPKNCKTDCEYGQWTDFGACDNTCGAGFKYKTRKILVNGILGGNTCDSQQLIGSTSCEDYSKCPEPYWIKKNNGDGVMFVNKKLENTLEYDDDAKIICAKKTLEYCCVECSLKPSCKLIIFHYN